MPEPTDEELGIDEQSMPGLDPNIRTELRRTRIVQRENDVLREQAATSAREAAFAKAGVPDTPLVAQLAKTYEGDNDPAAVRAYFESLGVDLAGGGGQQQQTDDAELAAQRQVAQVGSSGETGGAVRFEDAIGSTRNSDEVMALIASAPEGATTYVEGRQRRIGPPTIE